MLSTYWTTFSIASLCSFSLAACFFGCTAHTTTAAPLLHKPFPIERAHFLSQFIFYNFYILRPVHFKRLAGWLITVSFERAHCIVINAERPVCVGEHSNVVSCFNATQLVKVCAVSTR